MTQLDFPSPNLIGSFRSFGPVGPAYRVMEPVRQLDDGDWLMRVEILESGERVEYRYTAVLDDPKAI